MPKKKSYAHWWPRYVADYREKTSKLSIIEHGAYGLLLDEYYFTEKPLPANASLLHRICRATSMQEQEAVDAIIAQFFVLTPDGYRNKKADEQLVKRLNIKEKRSNAAFTRHENKDANASLLHAENDANASPTAITAITAKLATENLNFKAVNNGDKSRTPKTHDEEILPSCWHDYAEAKGIPDAQIYKSWRKFKNTAKSPWHLKQWESWCDLERF